MKYVSLMKVYQCDENFSLWCKFTFTMKIDQWNENLSLWWKFITVIKNHYCDETIWQLLKLIVVIKICYCTVNLSLRWKILCDKNSYKWWLVKIYNSDQNYFLWWLMKQYYCDEKSLLWWKSIILGLPVLFGHPSVTLIVLIDHFYEIHQWELIIVMIIQCRDEIHHCDDNLL